MHTHVRSDEHPLGQFVVVQVFIEHCEVLRFCKTVGIRCNRVVAHQWTWKQFVSNFLLWGNGVVGRSTCACACSHLHLSSGWDSLPRSQNKAYPPDTNSS